MPQEKVICGFCTKNVAHLNKHTKAIHPNQNLLKLIIDKDQKCPHCSISLSYIKKDSFLNHVRTCYLNPSRIYRTGGPFICPHCESERKFSRKFHLIRHLKLKHDPSKINEQETSNTLLGREESAIVTERIYDLIYGKLDPKLLIDLNRIEEQNVERIQLKGSKKGFRFTDLCRQLSSYGFFIECFSTAFKYLIDVEGIRKNHLLSISLEAPSELEYPIPMPLMRGQDFKLEHLLDRIEMVIQSHSRLGLNSDLLLNVVTLPDPQGGAAGARLNPRRFYRLEEYLKRKSGLLDPSDFQPEENICLPLCVAFSTISQNQKRFNQTKEEIRKENKLPRKLLSIISTIYSDVLKLDYNSRIDLCTNVFDKIQDWLGQNFHQRLIVYKLCSDKVSDSEILYPGNGNYVITTSLLIYQTHCYLIINESLFFGKQVASFCRRCCEIHPRRQFCNILCRLCTSQTCANSYPHSDGIRRNECNNCNRFFKNEYCFNMHLALKVCQKLSVCSTCQKTMPRSALPTHMCLLHACLNCKELVEADHKCFVLPILDTKQQQQNKPQVYIFFDIESMQHNNGRHEPDVLVLYRCCEICIDQLDNMEAICCHGLRRHWYVGTDCIEQSIEFIFFHPDNRDGIAIAHFGSGYDFNFVLKTLLNLGHRPTKLFCRNLRILTLTAGYNVTLKDSYLWFGCKLRSLSDLWSLPVRKCYFNHAWNTPDTLKYEGPWPSMEEFKVPKYDQPDFVPWYEKNSTERPVYKTQEELLRYCEVDVELLYRAGQRFRSMVMEYANIDPFKVSISIASLTAYTYRKHYLQPLTLPLIMDKNCAAVGLRQQSKIALKYLSWLVRTEYPNLKYAGNGPERRIANYTVDGFDCATNSIVEVFGDCIHACPKHTSPGTRHPLKPHLTNGDVLDNSMAKIFYLQKMNYNVKVVWECEIMDMLKEDCAMKKWFNDRERWKDLTETIGARDALHGGRVEAFVLLLELTPEMIAAGWRMFHLDVVSLYPQVQSDPAYYYPTSHPIVINGCELPNEGQYPSAEEMKKYFGLISCLCYAPPDLLIPVLPVKHPDSGRLVFPLCGSCAFTTDHSVECEHRGEDRSFYGCWTTPELFKAVDSGYTVVKVHQIWHFEHRSNTIFRKYIQNWMRLKYAASGWPDECRTEEERKTFLHGLYLNYGIELEMEGVSKNAPLRTLAKHFLNNLWGKLSTRQDRVGRQVHFIASEQELCTLMKNPKQELVAFNGITDNFAIVETLTKDEFHFGSFHNPVIAAFVTSYGRLCLLDHLNRPQPGRIIYTDTDSIVYLANINEPDPYEKYKGNMLGMLKNELKSADDYIIRWISLASKTYSYETAGGEVLHRSKGLVINDSIADNFNFDLLKSLLLKDSKTIKDFYDNLPDQELADRLRTEMRAKFPNQIGVLLPQPTITRNFKKNEDVMSRNDRTKFLRFNFTKRKFIDNKINQIIYDDLCRMRSVPWGYVQLNE